MESENATIDRDAQTRYQTIAVGALSVVSRCQRVSGGLLGVLVISTPWLQAGVEIMRISTQLAEFTCLETTCFLLSHIFRTLHTGVLLTN